MATVNLGRVKPLWQGQFNPDTQYEPLDYLKYNGGLYFCVATPPEGTLPTNATYFEPVVNPADISSIEYWSTLSGSLLRPALTYHNGDYWMLTTDLTDVETAEPGVSESWTRISQDDLGILTPTIISPADGTEDFYGIIESSAYETGPRFSGTHNKSLFQASTVPDFATIYAEEEITTGNLTQWEMPLPDPLTRVWVRVLYESLENASYFSAPVEIVIANYSAPAPTFIDPADGEAAWMPGSTIQISAYAPNLPDDQIAANWQILNAGGTVVWQSLDDANNLTSITPPNNIFNPEATHTLRAAHIGRFFGEQAYGEISVTTIAAPTPALSAPLDGETGLGPTPTLEIDPIDPAFTHTASQWRALLNSDGALVHDSGETANSLEAYTLPSGVVAPSEAYLWEMRVKTDEYGWGNYVPQRAFTTKANFPPSVVVSGTPTLPSSPRDLSVSANIISLSLGNNGVYIYNSDNWQVIAEGLQNNDGVTSLVSDQDNLYILTQHSIYWSVGAYDFSTLETTVLAGTTYYSVDIKEQGEYLYLAVYYSSNHSVMRILKADGSVERNFILPAERPRSMHVDSMFLYIGTSSGIEVFQTVDGVADPSFPSLSERVTAITSDDDFVYVATRLPSALFIIDKASKSLVPGVPIPPGEVSDMSVDSDYLYMTHDGPDGIAVMDKSDWQIFSNTPSLQGAGTCVMASGGRVYAGSTQSPYFATLE